MSSSALIILILLSFIGLFSFFIGKKQYILYLLIASIYLAPRIPLGQLTGMQRLDVRLDDVFAMLIIILGGLSALYDRIKLPKYTFFMFAYLIVSLVSTLFSFLCIETSFVRILIYWFKETEYILLAFFIPYFICRKKTLIGILYSLISVAFLNGCWLLYQILSQQKIQLFKFVDIPSYGFVMIGESQPFQTGALWSFLLMLSVWLLTIYKKWRFISLTMMVVTLFGLVSTLSRSCILGNIIALLLSAVLVFKKSKNILPILGVSVLLFCAIAIFSDTLLLYLQNLNLPVFRLESDAVLNSLEKVRLEEIWKPLWSNFLLKPLIGHGKGNLLYLQGNYDEAHNYYLKSLVETGMLGACLIGVYFLFVSIHLIRSIKLNGSPETMVFVYLSLTNMLFVFLISFSQDSLYSSKIAMPFYASLGIFNYICNYDPVFISADKYKYGNISGFSPVVFRNKSVPA